jgi:hypothetical protein
MDKKYDKTRTFHSGKEQELKQIEEVRRRIEELPEITIKPPPPE